MAKIPDTGRTILVTGAGKRIGRAVAEALAGPGMRMAIHYRTSATEAAETVAACRARGAEAAAFCADLTDTAGVDAMAEAVFRAFGAIDLLIASAAVFRQTPWPAITDADWDYHLDGNLKAVFRLVRAFAPKLSEDSLIITFGDWSGIRPYRGFVPYCVSKAGVIALTQALAQEMAPKTRVNCICPGTILPPARATPAEREALEAAAPLQRIGSPDDIIAAVRFFIDSTFTTGSHLVVDGGRLIANADWSPDTTVL